MNSLPRHTFYKLGIFLYCLFALLGLTYAAAAGPEVGSFNKESVYSNAYFGLTLQAPAHWHPLKKEAMKELSQRGKDALAGEDKNMAAALKAAEKSTVNLFYVFQHPLGQPTEFNPSIGSAAEKVAGFAGIKTGQDYLLNTKKIMESGQMKLEFGQMRQETLGGAEFYVLPVVMNFGNRLIKQEYYATLKKGYALSFVMTYDTDEQYGILRGAIKSLHFAS